MGYWKIVKCTVPDVVDVIFVKSTLGLNSLALLKNI